MEKSKLMLERTINALVYYYDSYSYISFVIEIGFEFHQSINT